MSAFGQFVLTYFCQFEKNEEGAVPDWTDWHAYTLTYDDLHATDWQIAAEGTPQSTDNPEPLSLTERVQALIAAADELAREKLLKEDQAMNDAQETTQDMRSKTVINTDPKTLITTDIKGTHQNVPDVEVYGDGDTFRLWVKAASQAEGWMKTSKVANLPRGCLVQTETQQRNPDGSYALSQALAYVPGQWLNKATDPPEMRPFYVSTTHEKKTLQSMLEQDDEALVDAWLDAIRHGVVRGKGDDERLAFVAGWRAAWENVDQL